MAKSWLGGANMAKIGQGRGSVVTGREGTRGFTGTCIRFYVRAHTPGAGVFLRERHYRPSDLGTASRWAHRGQRGILRAKVEEDV